MMKKLVTLFILTIFLSSGALAQTGVRAVSVDPVEHERIQELIQDQRVNRAAFKEDVRHLRQTRENPTATDNTRALRVARYSQGIAQRLDYYLSKTLRRVESGGLEDEFPETTQQLRNGLRQVKLIERNLDRMLEDNKIEGAEVTELRSILRDFRRLIKQFKNMKRLFDAERDNRLTALSVRVREQKTAIASDLGSTGVEPTAVSMKLDEVDSAAGQLGGGVTTEPTTVKKKRVSLAKTSLQSIYG